MYCPTPEQNKVKQIIACEILDELVPLIKANSIVAEYEDDLILRCGDFMEVKDINEFKTKTKSPCLNKYGRFNFGIINPPYTVKKQGNIYDSLCGKRVKPPYFKTKLIQSKWIGSSFIKFQF
jgi:tRNA1(Val) A37 N6-methylase TrmN6